MEGTGRSTEAIYLGGMWEAGVELSVRGREEPKPQKTARGKLA